MQGTMLWFNEAEDFGFILTDEGERLSVLGEGFAGGARTSPSFLRSPRGAPAFAAGAAGSRVDRREGPMSSSSKKQTTMAKRAREQAVKERRERKLAKKREAAAARKAQAEPDGTVL